jgi:CubicO group peptidase (beta-lactamase class C family)
VARGDAITVLRAYGSSRAKPRAADAFWIGSMTKSFSAAAILKLQEEQRLALTDSVGPFFPDAPADKSGITLRRLLTHTAGFVTTYTGGGIIERNTAVRAILSQPLGYASGHGYRYVDDDYELLAAIVETASGLTWEAYVEQKLLSPAGLSRTGFWRGPKVGAADWGHRGANGMSSTAEDLFRWTRALRGGRILNAADAELLSSRQVFVRNEPPDSVYYSYGTRIYARNGKIVEVMHSGSSDAGNTGVVRVLSSGVTIIVLSNSGMHGGTTWSSLVAQRLAIRQ